MAHQHHPLFGQGQGSIPVVIQGQRTRLSYGAVTSHLGSSRRLTRRPQSSQCLAIESLLWWTCRGPFDFSTLGPSYARCTDQDQGLPHSTFAFVRVVRILPRAHYHASPRIIFGTLIRRGLGGQQGSDPIPPCRPTDCDTNCLSLVAGSPERQ